MERSDGVFQLVVWGERLKGEDRVTVHLGGTHLSVEVHDPSVGTEPVQTHREIKALALTLTDHPLIVAITPNPSQTP